MLLNSYKANNAEYIPYVNENICIKMSYEKNADASINDSMADDTDKILRELFAQIHETQGLSYRSWAASAGLSEGLLRKYIKGEQKSITIYSAQKLLAAVRLSLSQVFDSHRQKQIPIRGEVPQEGELLHESSEYITWHEVPGEIFALTVVGNSMNMCAPSGSQIIIDALQTDKLELVDKLVVIRHNGRLIFRKLRINPTRFEAMSNDDSIEPTIPHSSSDWEIVGRVIYVVREV